MQATRLQRSLLALCSLIAVAIGASILFAPAAFHASNGIELGADPSLLSELRAPGGALLALGALMGVGVFRRSMTLLSMGIAGTVYLSYGASRLIAMALDGLPATGLVVAAGIELALGLACVLALRSVGSGHEARAAVRGTGDGARDPRPGAAPRVRPHAG